MRKRYAKPYITDIERWLERYQKALNDERLLMNRIDALEARTQSVTARITGMPKGECDDAVPNLIDERERLKRLVLEAEEVKTAISNVIDRLPEDERNLLTAYYIDGYSLERAAEFVPCSKRAAIDMKKVAIRHIESLLK